MIKIEDNDLLADGSLTLSHSVNSDPLSQFYNSDIFMLFSSEFDSLKIPERAEHFI